MAIPEQVNVTPSTSTDWVGYEVLIDFILSHGLLAIEGDMVEIGTFLGGGAYKLSMLLTDRAPHKRLYVVDVFDPAVDSTANTNGDAMSSLYKHALMAYPGKTQWDVFCEVTRACKNIEVIVADSRTVSFDDKLFCFGFIDGNHQPDYVESDFHLVWNCLVPGGSVAFHDYGWDLPGVTTMIDGLVARHSNEILLTHHNESTHVLFVVKR